MISHEIPFLASSDPDVGAINVSADGSVFSVRLTEPIQIPQNAVNVILTAEENTIWWNTPNIVLGVNDLFKLVDDGTDSTIAFTYNLVIPEGLYDLSGLNQAIQRELANLGAPQSPPLINLSADDATQKVEITTNFTGLTIDFTIVQSFRDILGFNSQLLGPTATKPLTFLADNVAAFNVVDFFLIHTDLVDFGLLFNNEWSQITAQVLIDVAPGSQIVNRIFNPPKIPSPNLIGGNRSNIRFWLTDNKNLPVNTRGEFWTTRMAIRYDTPV